VNNGSFSANNVPLNEGANTLTATATDPAGNEGTASINGTLDTTPPAITITDPADNFLTSQSIITVTGTVDDDTATVEVNGVAATVAAGTFTATGVTLTEGANTITATATDPTGNKGTASVSGTLDTTAPVIDITDPTDNFLTSQATITVSGTVNDNTATVNVNGIAATVNNNTLTAEGVTLAEGANTLTATATDPAGNQGTTSVSGTLDTTPPIVAITDPTDNFLTSQTPIMVTGTVDDDTATVVVNGVAAAVAAGAFTATGVTLNEGANTITATATDPAGNQGIASVSGTQDTQSPAINITSPADNSEIDTNTPLITIDYSDTGIGINTATFQASINGVDYTSSFSIGVNQATYQTTEALPEGANTITASIEDLAVNSASAASNFTVDTIQEPIVTETSGFLDGIVYDSTTDLPVEGARVTLKDVYGEVFTDAEGKFAFPTPDAGTYYMTITKNGHTYAQREITVVSTRDAAVDPVYLKPTDPVSALITPEEGGTLVDSTGNIELIFEPGTVDEPVTVSATWYEGSKELPAPLPENSHFTWALSPEPEGLTFNKPVKLRVANTYGFEPGTPIPIGAYNSETQQWEPYGMGEIDTIGAYGEFVISAFFPFDCNLARRIPVPIPPFPTPKTEILPNTSDEHLKISQSLTKIQSLLDLLDIRFLYNSNTINQNILLGVDAYVPIEGDPDFPVGAEAPSTMGFLVKIEGVRKLIRFEGDNGNLKQAVMFDSHNGRGIKLSTGSYPIKIAVSNDYVPEFATTNEFGGLPLVGLGIQALTTEPFSVTDKINERLVINDQSDSPFGAGWGISGLQRLHFDPDQTITLTSGDGSGTYYIYLRTEADNTRIYSSLENDFSALVGNADGTFTRTLKSGTKYNYNAIGLLTSKIDLNNNTVEYVYDSEEKLTTIITPFGKLFSFNYDANGYISSVIDPAGQITQFVVDQNGNLTRIVYPDGTRTNYRYDANHLLLTKIDPKESTTEYQYDVYNRLEKMFLPANSSMDYDFGSAKKLINELNQYEGTLVNPAPVFHSDDINYNQYTDALGNTTKTKTNRFGRLLEITDPLEHTTYFERDCACGAPTKITHPNGNIITMTYDDRGNMLTQTDESSGATITYTYEPIFNKVKSITDPNGNFTQMSYDGNGNLTQITDTTNNTIDITHNSRGQITGITNANNETTTFTYDLDTGYLTSTTNPLGHTTTYAYDAVGNLLSVTDNDDHIVATYTYDIMNRLSSVTDTAGGITQYDYDVDGSLLSITDAKGQVTQFEYNDQKLLDRSIDPLGNIRNYTYDLNGNLVNAANADGKAVNFTYDPANRLVQTLLPENDLIVYVYDELNKLTDTFRPGNDVGMIYDLQGRLASSDAKLYLQDEKTDIIRITRDLSIGEDDYGFKNIDVIVDGATLEFSGIHSLNTLKVINNGKITTPQGKGLNLTVQSFILENGSSIDLTGKGYAPGYTLGNNTDGAGTYYSGGSYGGRGGNGTYGHGGFSNEAYGDYRDPNEMGSGGGHILYATAGGGLLSITADTIVLDGDILANGVGSESFASGSGGGVLINVSNLSGNGTIFANGGSNTAGYGYKPGAGGGGRIALYYDDISGFNIANITVYGGDGYYKDGAAGTFYLKGNIQSVGDLIVDNRGVITDGYSTPLRSIGTGISDSLIYSPTTGQSTLTDPDATWPVPDPATGALGLIGLTLNPNTNQAEPRDTFEVLNNTATTITVNGDMTTAATVGDSYIGEYTFDNLYIRGQATLSTEDDVYVLGTVEVDNATLRAHSLKLTDSLQLQATDATIEVVEPLFDGHATVTLDGDTLTVNNISGMNTLQLTNSAVVNSFSLIPLDITVNTLIIDATSSIDLTGKGYAPGYTLGNTTDGASTYYSGGSYGGLGGNGTYGPGGVSNEVYGDYRDPNEMGSGGGHITYATSGGGLTRIIADTITLNGAISANGEDGASIACGSGGGVRIDVGTLSGSGTISADGGNHGSAGWYPGAGGGGGRIALYYDDISGFNIANITVYGGDGYYKDGGAGTVYLKSTTQSHGDLIVDNRGVITDGYSTPLRAIGSGISDSIVYSLSTDQSTLSNTTATWPVPDSATGALGLIGLELNPDTSQSQTFTVVDNLLTTITVNGDMTAVATAGDNYIGEYRFNNLSVTGGAQVSTDDDVYFDTLDTTGGILNANNIYQAGMNDPAMFLASMMQASMMQALDFSTEMDILENNAGAINSLARIIDGRRKTNLLMADAGPVLGSPKKIRTQGLYNSGIKSEDILSKLKTDDSLSIATNTSKQEQPILLAQLDTLATDAALYAEEKTAATAKKDCPNNLDPLYTYDLNGNRASMTDPVGTTFYAYDELNRITSITNPYGETTRYTYDNIGRRTSTTLPNGVVTSYGYDAAGQLLSLVHKLSNTTIASFGYTYDYKGNRTSMTDLDGTHDYLYDQLNQLIQATHPQPANPMESFDYDPVGNSLGYTYNDANQLLENDSYIYSYDKDGNLREKEDKASGEVTRFTYNVIRELTDIEIYTSETAPSPTMHAHYIYDGLRRRIVKDVDGTFTRYIYDNEDIILELDGTGAQLAYYTHGQGVDEPISMQRAGQNYYFITDALGSIIKIVDTSGDMVNEYVYDSFGNMVSKTEGVTNYYTYTGREWDPETGLFYYRMRYYDSATGRFLNQDPLGHSQGPNFYAYTGNNPVIYTDSFGLWLPSGHTDLTWRAMRAFEGEFTLLDISQAIAANLAVDNPFNQLSGYMHYMYGTEVAAEGFIEANLWAAGHAGALLLNQPAMIFLGTGLHTVQDKYAHFMHQVSTWEEHKAVDADNPQKHKAKYEMAYQRSVGYIQQYLIMKKTIWAFFGRKVADFLDLF
jgi:RHS repeat-associated protein